MTDPSERSKTDWFRVALLVSAGIASAAHIGKIPGALPVLVPALQLDLATSALLTSIYSLVAATCGLLFGLVAQRFGALPLVIAGLAVSAGASLAGAFAASALLLLATRVAEGLGFIMTVVAVPSLIIGETRTEDRPLAMGFWGTYVPAGTSLMMLVTAATLGAVGWRGVWGLAAALSAASALAVLWWMPAAARRSGAAVPWRTVVAGALERRSLLLAGCFLAYGAQYLAVTAFLPLMLVQRLGVGVAAAGLIGAGVAAANIAGNVGSGWLAGRGWTARQVVMLGALGMAATSLPIFADGSPLLVRICAAALFTAVGGLIPGTLLGSAPRVADSAGAAAGVVGLMIQGAGVGQLLGPPLFAKSIGVSGSWTGAWLFMGAAALLLVGLASRLSVLDRPPTAVPDMGTAS